MNNRIKELSENMLSNERNEVPSGRIIPVYLTNEGDVYPIRFHNMEELDLIQKLVAGFLDNRVGVDFNCMINNPKNKISIMEVKR